MASPILYSAGTVISSNYPLVHVLCDENKSQYCDQCFKKSSSLKKCSGCSGMFYCNSACQKLDWKGKHKLECSSTNFAKLNTVNRFINRLKLAVKDETSLQQKFYLRPSNQNDGGESKSFTLLDLCSQTQGSDEKMSKKLHKLIKRHSRPILDDRAFIIGLGLYVAEACSTGYSCAPNAVPSFSGTRADLRAMTDIRAGQHITTGMDFYPMPKIERRSLLLREFGIDCHCELCEEENDTDYKAFARMNRRREEFIVDYHDLKSLQQLTVLSKHFVVTLKKRFKYHHPYLSQSLLYVFIFTQYSLDHNLKIVVPKFDRMYPDLANSVVESMKITHDPGHKHWEIVRDFVLEHTRQTPNLDALKRLTNLLLDLHLTN